jgi:hypothetical protein
LERIAARAGRRLRWFSQAGRLVAALLFVAPGAWSTGAFGSSAPAQPAVPSILKSSQITYMTDVFKSLECFPPAGEGWTANLHYEVLYPQDGPGVTHPILFAIKGAAFNDNTSCTDGVNNYQRMDDVITPWVRRGFVVVNVEYHSKNNGLYGDASCPNPTCSPPWDDLADGVAELNLKNAINFFFDHDPAQYGADESKGIVIFSTSSAANYSFVLGATSPVGTHTLDAVIGWSGLGDPSVSGEAEANYEDYMESTDPSSDRYHFGSPVQRISSTSPAIWISSSLGEVVAPERRAR